MSNDKTITVHVKPAIAAITPYAMARMSHHFFEAGRQYVPVGKEVPLVKYYLYCASIELAAKAAVLATDCTPEHKEQLRKQIGHDLVKALTKLTDHYDTNFLGEADHEVIAKVNPYFKGKGLEYFTLEMMGVALTGYKALPAIADLEAVAVKLQEFATSHQHFKHATTSHQPQGGVISFV